MSGLQILTLLSHDQNLAPPVSLEDDEVAQLAGKLVANAISKVEALRELRPRMFPDNADPKALEIAHALRVEFENWVRDAEALYADCKQLQAAGHNVARLEELGDFSGLTQAMLKVTLESHLLSVEQANRGETIPIGHMRREIQLKLNR